MMIQDFVPDRDLADAWKDMSWLKKELVVRKAVGYLVQLFEKRFTDLGNLYATKDLQKFCTALIPDAKLLGAEHSVGTDAFCQSRIVSKLFFWGKAVSYHVHRGPFTNSRDWLAAQIQLHLFASDNDSISDSSSNSGSDTDDDSDDDCKDPYSSDEAVKRRADRLRALLPTVFPEDEVEEFVLHHNGLDSNNIIVNSSDEIRGIIDWECVHMVPLY
jgi:hypothetical protein